MYVATRSHSRIQSFASHTVSPPSARTLGFSTVLSTIFRPCVNAVICHFLSLSLSLSVCVQHHAYSPHHNLQITPHAHKEKRKNVIFRLRLRLHLHLQHATTNNPKNPHQPDTSPPPPPTKKKRKEERKKDRNESSPKPPLDPDSFLEKQTRPASLKPGERSKFKRRGVFAQPGRTSLEPRGLEKKAPNPLHALRIIQLPVVNSRIIPSGRRVIDIKVSLDLPVDVDHRAIGAMVRDQDFNLRGPVLLYRSAGNAVPGKKRKPSVSVAN